MSYDISNSKTRQRELAALFAAGAKFNCTDILLITDHESGDEKRGDLRFPRASRRSAIARSGTASRCVVYFMGNAPAVAADAYASTPSTLVSYAKYGTKGWRANAPTARDLPERWPEENSYSRAMSTWTPVQYKVTFDADEGIFADTSLGTYVCQQAVHTAYSLPPSAPVLAGHRSEGWWTETVGGTKVTPSTAVVLTKAHTLYAHWTPDEPIPELPPTASEADVRTALEGPADARLLENITDAATYGRYREWAMGIGADAVKGAENSWISFAVDSATLPERVPTDGDLKIEEFGPSSSEEGAFDFTVSVNGVGVGSGATDANLKKVFGLGGTTRIGEEEFDPDQVSLEFGTPVGGRLKFTAAPKDRTVRAFFMKMKVN